MTGVILLIAVIAVVAIILSLVSAMGAAPAALIISFISLGISILAYHRTGGTTELLRKVESSVSSEDLKKQMDALTAMTDSLREKTADALDRLEKVIRKAEKGE
jgi:ABC-type transport system involved in cytochrome bd biosynthesis fused ATPase/permease subunit